MRDSVRLTATLIIWLAFIITMAVLLTTPTGAVSQADGPTVFGIVLVIALAAMASTAVGCPARQGRGAQSRSKAKERWQPIGGWSKRWTMTIYDLEALLLARDEQRAAATRARAEHTRSYHPHDRRTIQL